MRKKVTVVGAGQVGSTTAMRIAEKELADVVLIDIIDGVPLGKALDIYEAGSIEQHDCKVFGCTDQYDDARDSDIVIITAGVARKPGMSRDDLLATNMGIMRSVAKEVARVAPDSIVIVVSNPLDAMCHVAYEVTGFSKNRVMGMAGVLDSARFAAFIAMELDVSVENIQTFVLGGHGDTMVPLPRFSTVAGIPIPELLPPERIEALVDRTRKAGAEIVELLKTGSAYYAPSSAAVEMAEAILKDKKKILPCSVYLQGEYGISDLFVGVPAKLGGHGVEKIIEVKLTEEEMAALHNSALSVKKLVDDMKRLQG
ncbi:MAG: malate dehydrogenase [Deltaproteobacteria bacterium]|nr:malate dehydrogenase [Deltaproteobacteria bacterium]MBW2137747.1 malate dehydrogenase [Deltaproteobacteria bacterium]